MNAVQRWLSLSLTGAERRWLFAGVVVIKVLILMVLLPALGERFPSLYQANLFPDRYDLIAENLLAGNGYRIYPDTSETMQRLPGFVLILAGMFFVFGKSLPAVICLNMMCSFITAWLILRIGQRFLALDRLALLAALAFLFYPGTILTESRGGVESVFTVLFTAAVYWFYVALESERWRDYFISGVFIAITAIIKSTTIILPGVFFLYLIAFARQRTLLTNIFTTMILVLPTIAILTPWVVRNHNLSGEFVPTQILAGSALYQGYKVTADETGRDHYLIIREATAEMDELARSQGFRFKSDFFQHFYEARDEVLFDRYVSELVTDIYAQDPALFMTGALKNVLRFWFQGRTEMTTMLNVVLVLPILIAFAIGVYQLGIRQRPILPMFMVGFFYVGAHLPLMAVARYHIPLTPLLFLFAVAALLALDRSANPSPSR